MAGIILFSYLMIALGFLLALAGAAAYRLGNERYRHLFAAAAASMIAGSVSLAVFLVNF